MTEITKPMADFKAQMIRHMHLTIDAAAETLEVGDIYSLYTTLAEEVRSCDEAGEINQRIRNEAIRLDKESFSKPSRG